MTDQHRLHVTRNQLKRAYRACGYRPIRDKFMARQPDSRWGCCGLTALYVSGAYPNLRSKDPRAKGVARIKIWATKVYGISYWIGFGNGWDGKEPANARATVKDLARYEAGFQDGSDLARVFLDRASK